MAIGCVLAGRRGVASSSKSFGQTTLVPQLATPLQRAGFALTPRLIKFGSSPLRRLVAFTQRSSECERGGRERDQRDGAEQAGDDQGAVVEVTLAGHQLAVAAVIQGRLLGGPNEPAQSRQREEAEKEDSQRE